MSKHGTAQLTLEVARELAEGTDIRAIKKLDASQRGIARVDDLSPCIELARLDLSHNFVQKLDGLFYCKTLTWLDVSHNQLESLLGIQSLTNLVVLRASHNAIAVCGDLSPLRNLKALILNNNQLSVLQGLSKLKELNTLVLSQNLFESLSLGRLTKLTKLSLSHNSLRTIPSTEHLPELKEVRLNDNKLSGIPDTLHLNQRLVLLDLGSNKFKDLSALCSLGDLKWLKNLNLKGNPLCAAEDYQQTVLGFVPSVQVLDGRKLTEVRKRREKSPKVRKKATQLKSHPASSKGKESRKKQLESESSGAVEQLQESDSSDLKQKKRKHEAGVIFGGTPLRKKSKLSKKCTASAELKMAEGTQDKRAHTEGRSPKHAKHLELQADDITALSGTSASDFAPTRRKKRTRKTTGKREGPGDHDYVSAMTTPQDGSSVALCDSGVEVTGLETETGLLSTTLPIGEKAATKRHPLMSKDRSGKSKKARSGVVAVEEIRPKMKRKKHSSLSRHVELFSTEIGTGQKSTWT